MATSNIANAVQVQAVGSVLAAGGLDVNPSNVVSAVRNSIGDYTITFGSEIVLANRNISFQPKGSAVTVPSIVAETLTTVQVRFLTVATVPALTDVDFDFEVKQNSLV